MRPILTFFIILLSLSATAQMSLQRVFLSDSAETLQRGCVGIFNDLETAVAQQVQDNLGRTGMLVSLHDVSLNVRWKKHFFDTDRLQPLQMEIIDDTIFICGVVYNELEGNIFIVKMDRQGNVIKYRVIEEEDSSYPYSIEAHPGGGFVIFGYNTTPTSSGWESSGRSITRFNSEIGITWSKKLNWRVNWGYSKVLSDGSMVCSGSGNIVRLDKDGNQLWTKNFPGYNYFLKAIEAGGKLYFCSFDYVMDYTRVLVLNMDGSIHTTSDGFKINNPQVTGLWKGIYPMVIGTQFNTDKVDVNITVLEPDGSIYTQFLLDNYFGFAPIGSLRDACSYAIDVDASGSPVILGVAYRMGYTLIRPGHEFSFPCLREQLDIEMGGSSTVSGLILNEVAYTPVMQDRAMPESQGSTYHDSLICYTCDTFPDLFPSDTVMCGGDTLLLDLTKLVGNVKWSDGSTARTKQVSRTGIYAVTIYGECDTASDTIRVSFMPVLHPSISWEPLDPLPGENTVFRGLPEQDGAGEWYRNDTLVGSGPQLVLTFPANGIYTMAYRVRDSIGCVYEITKPLKVALVDLYYPSVFTPNGDGLNDTWYPHGQGIESFEMDVFNRWGEKVFSAENTGWNGIYKGSALPGGLYVYRMRITDVNGRLHHVNGQIVLLR